MPASCSNFGPTKFSPIKRWTKQLGNSHLPIIGPLRFNLMDEILRAYTDQYTPEHPSKKIIIHILLSTYTSFLANNSHKYGNYFY
jgi:hypothetical protein